VQLKKFCAVSDENMRGSKVDILDYKKNAKLCVIFLRKIIEIGQQLLKLQLKM